MGKKYTYRDLQVFLANLTDDQLDQEMIVGTDNGYYYDCSVYVSTGAVYKEKKDQHPEPESIMEQSEYDALDDGDKKEWEVLTPAGRVFISY